MQKVPFTIYSIDNIDKWRVNYFSLIPLKVEETIEFELCKFLVQEFKLLENNLEMKYRIASKHIFIEMTRLIMGLITSYKMKELDQVEFVITDHRKPKDVILPKKLYTYELYKNNNNNIDFKYFHFKNIADVYYDDVVVWQKITRYIKNYTRYKKIRKIQSTHAALFGPNSSAIKYFKEKYVDTSIVLHAVDVFKEKWKNESYQKSNHKIIEIADRLAGGMNHIYKTIIGDDIADIIRLRFIKAVSDYFDRIEFDLRQARKFSEQLPKSTKLITGTAKHYVRVLSEAIRERGGEVIAFTHGGGMCATYWPSLSFTEFATCDKFVCYDEKESKDYEKYQKINNVNFPVVKGIEKSILNVNNIGLEKPQKLNLNEISTIMFVIRGQSYDDYTYGSRDSNHWLYMHLNIIELLISLKKKIIIKNRPKTPTVSKSFNHFGYFGKKAEHINNPLTEVLNLADVFVLESIASSALTEVMTLTKKPIILMKARIPKCTTEYEDILRSRCHVIEFYEDDRNRLCFNKNEFLSIFGIDRNSNDN
ncbi:MAG: hypothetical protein ISS28_04865 [Candidatus Cloacimonetes bacterium]|nr:hypothetical protein [Candidatus Cloacimonadota bacterium]